jgi:sodium/proline symporter
VLLAAILAAIMSTVDSQLLVCSASLAEDLYPLVTRRELTTEKRLQLGRIAVVALALLATVLAMNPDSKVLDVVSYAWAGLGASLGPAILVSLYWRGMTAAGAMAGVITGGLTVVLWSGLEGGLFDLYALVPGFIFALVAIVVFSLLTKSSLNPVVVEQFDQMHSQL